MSNENCESGCSCYTGGEIRHQKTCVNYPESLTEMYDLANEKIAHLEGVVIRLNQEADENQVKIKELSSSVQIRDNQIDKLITNTKEHEKHLVIQQDKINNLTERLDKSHNAHGTALETIDSLRDDIDLVLLYYQLLS